MSEMKPQEAARAAQSCYPSSNPLAQEAGCAEPSQYYAEYGQPASPQQVMYMAQTQAQRPQQPVPAESEACSCGSSDSAPASPQQQQPEAYGPYPSGVQGQPYAYQYFQGPAFGRPYAFPPNMAAPYGAYGQRPNEYPQASWFYGPQEFPGQMPAAPQAAAKEEHGGHCGGRADKQKSYSHEQEEFDEMKHLEHRYGQLWDIYNDFMQGKTDPVKIGTFLSQSSDHFWKGAIVGAALTFIATNSAVRSTLSEGLGSIFGVFSSAASKNKEKES